MTHDHEYCDKYQEQSGSHDKTPAVHEIERTNG